MTKVRYDYYYQQWVVEDDNGNLTYHDTKQQLEDYLDYCENQARIYAKTKGNKVSPQKRAEK